MSIFGSKFNTKTNTTSTKQVQQKITNFDETWLKISVIGGQTQLCPIKLSCTWAVPNISQKPPELNCNWFNKTQNSMNLIEGVSGSYYQPSLTDVGTIIHMQCIPFLEGAEYEGMPIIKEIGPVKVDPETQQQANELLCAKKAIFSLKIKNSDPTIAQNEALIKIQQSTFRIVQKLQEQQKQLMNCDIYEGILLLVGSRAKAKELEVSCQGGQKLIVELTNNKVRDVLLLLQKLLTLKNKQKQEMVQNQLPELTTQKEVKRQSQISDKTTNIAPSQENNASVRCQSNSNEGNEDDSRKKQPDTEDLSKSKQIQTFSEQRLGSEQNIDKNKNKNKKGDIMEIKSTQDLTQTSSPISKKKDTKIEEIPQFPSSPPPASNKQNALQILQITDLKKQIRTHQSQIYKLNKVIGQKNDKIDELQQQIGRMKERESNLSCNFFQLEDEVKRAKVASEKTSEQISYYKNQNRILKNENENAQRKVKAFLTQIHDLEVQLAPFLHKPEQEEQKQVETYKELQEKYRLQSVAFEQLQAKYLYMKGEADKAQEKQNQLRQMYEKMESQRNFFKKKFENITEQLLQSSSKPNYATLSPAIKNSKSTPERSPYSTIFSPESIPPEQGIISENSQKQQLDQYEKQILSLKKSLKDMIQENNFLRSVNVASSKNKKPTSKDQLKAQLADLKKIVSKLTQAVGQKDFAIENMKAVNKQISEKLFLAEKRLQEEQNKEKNQASRLKKVSS